MLLLNILGIILKIIGILLLGILLLLVCILLVLLFVPVRYRAKVVRNGKELSVQAQVSYIFHLIRLPVSFEDGKLRIRLRVFGITLFSNEGSQKARRRKRKKKKKSALEAKERMKETLQKENNHAVGQMDADAAGEDSGAAAGKNEGEGTTGNLQQPQNAKSMQGNTDVADSRGDAGAADAQGNADTADAQKNAEAIDADGQENADTQDIPSGILKPIWRIVRLVKKLLARIKAIFEKIAGTIRDIKEKIFNIKEKIFNIKMKITGIKGMVCLVLEFLRDEENKNGIKYAWKSILRLLKHVFPYKIEGEVVFATGNPYSMGRALSALGMLYPLYAKKLSLSADFEADSFRLDGCVQLKGRIRFGTVLWIAWKLWSKGKLKRLLSRARELKNKLTASAL